MSRHLLTLIIWITSLLAIVYAGIELDGNLAIPILIFIMTIIVVSRVWHREATLDDESSEAQEWHGKTFNIKNPWFREKVLGWLYVFFDKLVIPHMSEEELEKFRAEVAEEMQKHSDSPEQSEKPKRLGIEDQIEREIPLLSDDSEQQARYADST